MYLEIIALCCVVLSAKGQYYEVPDVLVEALHPKGLRVSIPDEDGIELFAFHGKINKPMKGREAGIFSEDIRSAENGRWIFYAKNARLKPGDTLYYWIHVNYDGVGYEKDGQPFKVTELIGGDASVSLATPPTTTSSTTERSLCVHGHTKVNGKNACKGMLIFQESFSTLDKNRWKPEVKFPQFPDFEYVIYEDDPRLLYIEDNNLHIRPKVTDEMYGKDAVYNELDLNTRCTGLLQSVECIQTPKGWSILPPVTSAQISTIESFSFVYGAIEVKAKLPKGDWLYPEISLAPKSEIYGPQYDSGRIRIAMVYGNRELSNDLYAGGVLGSSDAARNYALKKIFSYNHWTDNFHVFRVEWRPDSITVKVDGTVFGTIYPPAGGFSTDQKIFQVDPAVAERWTKGTLLAPFDQEMYIMLGVAAGGQSFPDSIPNKPWENGEPKAPLYFYRNESIWKPTWDENSQLVVEYVKVWAV
ncbi:hypothetical protein RI129_008467 [Pyrocoelia pectoralis]|uniref:Uncharacterized protein n=1 Tax=Pyrocoelia pectoralis TaxID=417401 RepID=A0AAN7V5G6_9COLE